MADATRRNGSAPVILYEPPPRPPMIKPDGEVQFRHPGYASPHDVLFKLPRLDLSSTSVRGVHHGTALLACQILANNTADGYLATDGKGCHRVDLGPDYVLTESQYWFFPGPAQQIPYPVVPSFRDWAFPHGSPLATWPEPTGVIDAGTTDHRCVVTQTAGLVNAAHLIPATDEEWFKINAMFQYGTHHDVNQDANKTTLRHDLHYAFDSHLFAIVPKRDSYVVHQFNAATNSTMEFASAYHNHTVRQSQDVAPEFLLARFARAVLMLAKPFTAQSPVRRHVARFSMVDRDSAEGEDQDGGATAYEMRSEWLSPLQLYQQYGGGGTKSASPSKRKRDDRKPNGGRQEYDESDDGDGDNDNDNRSDTDDDWYERNVGVLLDEDRGRPRKRQCKDSGAHGQGSTGRPDPRSGTSPPSLSTSISSMHSLADIKRDVSPRRIKVDEGEMQIPYNHTSYPFYAQLSG